MIEYSVEVERCSFGLFAGGLPPVQKEWTTSKYEVDNYMNFLKKNSPMTYQRARIVSRNKIES